MFILNIEGAITDLAAEKKRNPDDIRHLGLDQILEDRPLGDGLWVELLNAIRKNLPPHITIETDTVADRPDVYKDGYERIYLVIDLIREAMKGYQPVEEIHKLRAHVENAIGERQSDYGDLEGCLNHFEEVAQKLETAYQEWLARSTSPSPPF